MEPKHTYYQGNVMASNDIDPSPNLASACRDYCLSWSGCIAWTAGFPQNCAVYSRLDAVKYATWYAGLAGKISCKGNFNLYVENDIKIGYAIFELRYTIM